MNILLTGGTGSLGRALVKELIQLNQFTRICIYSRDEHKQDQMRKDFQYTDGTQDNSKLRFFIGDIRDKDRLRLACRGIHLIVHAAALKIVPTAEYNPFEALKTNVLGAQNLIECAIAEANGTYPKVIAISTDKAVNPINLYGASKLCAEKLFLAANNIMGLQGPRFSICRYGNVSNSNGSVIPLFKKQIIAQRQPTLTHPDMTRFWITLEEAVKLIMNAFDHMYGGDIYVPAMPSYKIGDLALAMMQMAGYPSEKQWCNITGIRPGEKLHEMIITKEEIEKTTYHMYDKHYTILPWLVEKKALLTEAMTSDSDQVHRLTIDELKERLNETV